LHLAHQAIQIDNARVKNLLTAEGKQLLGEPGGALPCSVDLFKALPERIGLLYSLQR